MTEEEEMIRKRNMEYLARQAAHQEKLAKERADVARAREHAVSHRRCDDPA